MTYTKIHVRRLLIRYQMLCFESVTIYLNLFCLAYNKKCDYTFVWTVSLNSRK